MRSVALSRQGFPFALALLAGTLLAPAPARAVALGDIASQSSLGQPLRVIIPVTLSGNETLNAACLRLVADSTARGAPQIVTGRVSLERATTSPRLVITTAAPVNEPAIRLAVQTGCGSTTRRDYAVLLDPPGAESPLLVATADADEPAWWNSPRQRPTRALPRSSWGTPIATAQRAAPAPARSRSNEPPPPAPVAAASAAPAQVASPDFVTLVDASGAFIPEAAAAPLPTPPRPATTRSLALLPSPASRPEPQPPMALAIWRQVWPYAAGVFAAIALAFAAFVVRRHLALQSSWFTPGARGPLKADTQVGASQLSFAHFGAMTEPAPIRPRVAFEHPALTPEQTVATEELDTLLHDIQSDLIDERQVTQAWRAAATDSAVDIGSDSILKAIAAAERDLQIGAPEPAQVAMDSALDNDLLTVPNRPAKRG